MNYGSITLFYKLREFCKDVKMYCKKIPLYCSDNTQIIAKGLLFGSFSCKVNANENWFVLKYHLHLFINKLNGIAQTCTNSNKTVIV